MSDFLNYAGNLIGRANREAEQNRLMDEATKLIQSGAKMSALEVLVQPASDGSYVSSVRIKSLSRGRVVAQQFWNDLPAFTGRNDEQCIEALSLEIDSEIASQVKREREKCIETIDKRGNELRVSVSGDPFCAFNEGIEFAKKVICSRDDANASVPHTPAGSRDTR